MLKAIDPLNMHLRNKLLLYDSYALSKISWHLTVTDFGKTLVSENLNNIVTKYVCVEMGREGDRENREKEGRLLENWSCS